MLAVALICTAMAAAANWFSRVRPRGHLETVTKPLTTVLVIWVALAADGPKVATALAVVGLVFCLIGDIALLDVVDRFIVGLASFLVGHLVFVAMAVELHLRRPWWGLFAAVIVVLLGVFVARPIISGATRQSPELRVPVIAYFAVISAMGVVVAMTGRWWAIAGAAAFVLSDSLLGRRQFVGAQRWSSLAVMVTYHLALVGLALGLSGRLQQF